jgi:hypothetical protein
LKIALFSGLLGVVGGISALSLEIRIFSRKFKRIAGNSQKSRNFSARAGSFRSSAELLNFQSEIRKFGWSFDFPADEPVFPRRSGFSAEHCGFPARFFLFPANFSIFRQRFRSSAENLNFRGKIQIFAGNVRPPAGDLNVPRNFSIIPLKFQISGGTPDIPLKI